MDDDQKRNASLQNIFCGTVVNSRKPQFYINKWSKYPIGSQEGFYYDGVIIIRVLIFSR